MGILDGLASTVGGLLNTFGQEVTFVTAADFQTDYDPATGEHTEHLTESTVRALVEEMEENSGGVVRGDKRVTVAASAFQPTTETRVIIRGTSHAILKVDVQTGTDDALMFVCQARR